MTFDFKKIGTLALGVMQLAPPLINAIQKARGNDPGPVKQAAVMGGLGSLLHGTEVVAGQDLFDDPEALAATQEFINASVLYKNRMAAARARKEGIPAPAGIILPPPAHKEDPGS